MVIIQLLLDYVTHKVMNCRSTNSGIDSLKSCEFGSVIGTKGYCNSTGNINSYNNGCQEIDK